MKDLPLPITLNDSEEPFKLGTPELEKFKRNYGTLELALQTLRQGLYTGTMTVGYKDMLVSNINNTSRDILGLLGLGELLKKEDDERYERVRSVHAENRLLRQQLGEKVTNEDLRERLKTIESGLLQWFRETGFCHVVSVKFSASGVATVKLSLTQYDGRSVMSENKRPDGRIKLVAAGFLFEGDVLNGNDKHERFGLIDCDQNRQLVLDMIMSQFPTARVLNFEAHGSHQEGRRSQQNLWGVKVNIYNYDEFPAYVNPEIPA